ncbi:MAG: hypothetical protein GYA56_13330 [Geobacteraceae bacterium]|nr:hypothetical protein [Geobacteraceae bacterium]
MTSKTLRTAGFLAMSSAVLSIPFLILSYYFAEGNTPLTPYFQGLMQMVGIALFTCLTWLLKKLLNMRHSFHDTDNYLDFLIATNLFAGCAVIGGLFLPTWTEALEWFSLLLIAAFGIVQILFGIKLLKLPDSLNGMLRPFCFMTITTGLFTSSVVFLPIGVVTGAIADVMLGTIFFQAAGKVGDPVAE